MSLSIVQHGAAASSGTSAASVTLGSAPTNGNMLVAIGYALSVPGTPHNNWFPVIFGFNSGVGEYIVVWAKYAGAGESATQEPDSTSLPAWTLAMWEISGVSGVLSADFAEAYAQYLGSTSSAAITAFNNANSNELLLVSASQASTSAATLSISGGGTWTADNNAQGTADGFNQSIYSWHQALASAGNNINPTISSSVSFRLFDAILGLTSSPTGGTPNEVQEGWGSQASGTSVSVTLNAAPQNGNLLIATVNADAVMSANTGWTADTSAANGSQNMATFYKYAGVAESATQTPCTAAGGTGFLANIKEISGVSGSWSSDHVATHIAQESTSGGSVPTINFSTTDPNELVVGTVIGASAAAQVMGVSTGTACSAFQGPLLGVEFMGQSVFTIAPSASTTINPTLSGPTWFASAFLELKGGAAVTVTGNVSMLLHGVSFSISEAPEETGNVSMMLSEVSFLVEEAPEETGNVGLAIGQVTIAVNAFDVNDLSPIRQFSTFG